jgi:hypothetical protein
MGSIVCTDSPRAARLSGSTKCLRAVPLKQLDGVAQWRCTSPGSRSEQQQHDCRGRELSRPTHSRALGRTPERDGSPLGCAWGYRDGQCTRRCVVRQRASSVYLLSRHCKRLSCALQLVTGGNGNEILNITYSEGCVVSPPASVVRFPDALQSACSSIIATSMRRTLLRATSSASG